MSTVLRRSIRTRVAAALAIASACATMSIAGRLRAQPIDADPRTIISGARTAYQSKPTCERVIVTIKPAVGTVRKDEFVVRIDPGLPADPADDVLALEMGDLRVHAAGGVLSVVHASFPTTIYSAKYDVPLTQRQLRELLPPLPLPQWAIMQAPGDFTDIDLTPFTPDARFSSANSPDQSAEKPIWTVRGYCPRGDLTLTIDGLSQRLTKLSAAMKPENTTIEMTFEQIAKTPSASWVIDTTGRRVVDALWRLSEAMPPVKRGDTWPPNILRQINGKPDEVQLPAATIYTIITAPIAAGAKVEEVQAIGAAAKKAVDRAVKASVNSACSPLEFREVSALPSEPAGDDWKSIPARAADWWQTKNASEVLLLWPARATLSRFIPDAASVIVVVDFDRTVQGIIRLDGRADDVEAVAQEIGEALRRIKKPAATGPATPKEPANEKTPP